MLHSNGQLSSHVPHARQPCYSTLATLPPAPTGEEKTRGERKGGGTTMQPDCFLYFVTNGGTRIEVQDVNAAAAAAAPKAHRLQRHQLWSHSNGSGSGSGS